MHTLGFVHRPLFKIKINNTSCAELYWIEKTVLNVWVNSFSSQVQLSCVCIKRRPTLSPTSPVSILFRKHFDGKFQNPTNLERKMQFYLAVGMKFQSYSLYLLNVF